jgi:hypothetical protein
MAASLFSDKAHPATNGLGNQAPSKYRDVGWAIQRPKSQSLPLCGTAKLDEHLSLSSAATGGNVTSHSDNESPLPYSSGAINSASGSRAGLGKASTGTNS